MADVCPTSIECTEDFGEERIQQNKDLERMIEDVENISVHVTEMAYDMVVQRTSPELSDSLKTFEEYFLRCTAVFCDQAAWPRDVEHCQLQEPGFEIATEECPKNMERAEKNPEESAPTAPVDLQRVLRGLHAMSECMDSLALRTQLRQCDLIVCFSHPDKMASLERPEDTWPDTGTRSEE